jgi:hypothetical protein
MSLALHDDITIHRSDGLVYSLLALGSGMELVVCFGLNLAHFEPRYVQGHAVYIPFVSAWGASLPFPSLLRGWQSGHSAHFLRPCVGAPQGFLEALLRALETILGPSPLASAWGSVLFQLPHLLFSSLLLHTESLSALGIHRERCHRSSSSGLERLCLKAGSALVVMCVSFLTTPPGNKSRSNSCNQQN